MEFKGMYTALITPFSENGERIDYDRLSNIIEEQVRAGITGVVPSGTTGESPTLDNDEHREVIKKTVELVNGRMQVVAGTGSNSTAEAIEMTAYACEAGVDAVMLVNPYYNKPNQEGLYQHFKAVSQVSSVPVVLYNIKGRTNVNLEVDTIRRLMEVENILSIKEASGDLAQMAAIIKACGERLPLLSGDDNIIPAVMSLGGVGAISVTSNIFPAKMVRMMNLYRNGDFKAGNEIFYNLLDFMQALFWETNPVGVKAAASKKGICNGSLRLPLVAMSSDKQAALAKLMEAVGADQ